MGEYAYLSRVQSNLADIRANRCDLHRHPELGFHEFRTSAQVAEYLKQLGLEA